MVEDSPPPFIVIRTPRRKTAYERALDLVGCVQSVLDHAKARHHVKDRLDRVVTALVFELSKLKLVRNSQQWRHVRSAQDLAHDCATILDILAHQQAAPVDELEAARKLVHDLLAELARLG
jgi:hypothetical protein